MKRMKKSVPRSLPMRAALQAARALLVQERLAAYATEKANRPDVAARILEPYLAGQEQEVFMVLLLSTPLYPLDVVELYRGTLGGLTVRTAEVFREAVRRNAAAIIVAHNHPSGDPTPSPEDVQLTRELVQAGKILELPLEDHIVFGGGDRWVSIREANPDLWWLGGAL